MTVEHGMKAALEVVEGLRISETWPDSINTDALIISGPTTMDDADMEGRDVAMVYELTLLFGLAGGMERAHERLMPYLLKDGHHSIRSALYRDSTLGGEIQTLFWRGLMQPPGRILISGKGLGAEVPVSEYYGAVAQIEVIA